MKFQNSKGTVYYGMHFYPGVAEYKDPAKPDEAYRVFINEDTIRSMSPTFAGRPIFVEHVDEVDQDIDSLRNEADGWVIESFFNPADGKTWAKFIVVSERGERAIKNGFKLSNAYVPRAFGPGGLWNGVAYKQEVTSGEFEHLAIVRNPRYEESRILTPEEFKLYNEAKELELRKLANSKDENKGDKSMKLNLFKRSKVENSADLEGMSVVLPKSGKEKTLTQLVNEADAAAEMEGKAKMANGEDEVMVGEKKMKLNELLKMHEAMANELKALKEQNAGGEGSEEEESMENEDEESESMDNEEEDAAREKEIADAKSKKSNEDKEAADAEKKQNSADAKKKRDRAHFEALKNARENAEEETVSIDLSEDRVARGKTRYGS